MFFSILFILFSVWLGLMTLLYFFQSSYVFQPSQDIVTSPAAIDLLYEDIYLTTKDNQKINAWWLPHPNPRFTCLFFHGNAGNISHRLNTLKIFHELGFSVLIIDYRGYGNSTGNISEKGSYIDAETAWLYLIKEQQIKPEKIIIFGRSLGGGVASWLAEKYDVAGVILESTFTSIADMGKHYYPYIPINLISHIKYDTDSRINKINSPILITHSPEDEIVPYELGKSLYNKANEPKHFLQLQGDHNYGYQQSANLYINGMNNFLQRLEAK